ncbi:MAG: AAA family ATPase [Candidatus Diapherotrites archaeon]|nr:AAA family ATPase [Candidatus Diapherotrites archaeon]
MIVLITGTPGTGKSTVAKALKARLGQGWTVINDREFCKKFKIGFFDKKAQELEVPVKKLEAKLKQKLKKEGSIILEGHLFCETKIPADIIVLLRTSPKLLETRLLGKGYGQLKVLDNVFCEMTDYCKANVLKNFGKNKVLELNNDKGLKEITAKILKEIKN